VAEDGDPPGVCLSICMGRRMCPCVRDVGLVSQVWGLVGSASIFSDVGGGAGAVL